MCEELYQHGESKNYPVIVDSFTSTLNSLVRPVSILTARTLQNIYNNQVFKVLFDSGSDITLINQRSIPNNVSPATTRQSVNGIHGKRPLTQCVLLREISFPEFAATQRVPGPVKAMVFQNVDTPYDIIIGMDLMIPLGIDVRTSTRTVTWGENTIPFRPRDFFSTSNFTTDLFDDFPESSAATTLPSKYESVDTDNVAQQQQHLTAPQREQLATLLHNYKKLFDGHLGQYPGRKIHLDLLPGAKAVSSRPYPVPMHNRQVFKDELDRLVELGVLEPCGAKEWLTPIFIVPKKDGRVRWVSDFRALNKVIRRKVYNLPIIHDILKRRSGYSFFSKLDISMQYYTFETG